jgi:hypothetical protein
MGMFDRLHLLGDDASKVRCAAGHPADGELATKTFDCLLDDYYVFEGRLYRCRRTEDRPDDLAPRVDGDKLVLLRRETAPRVQFTGVASVHTHCAACDPVVFERESPERVDHRRVWCEWDLTFDDGKLARVEPVRLETREEVRQHLLRDGVGVLPDDDRIARRHIKLVREGRTNLW